MHRNTLAGLFILVSAAACGPGRPPVASAPAPAPAPVAPPAPRIDQVTRADQAAPAGTSAAIGADLLGTAQYDLPMQANLAVRNELEFLVYQRHDVVGGWLRNAERYHEFVRDVFASYGVPRDLSHLGMIESGYRPTVRSHAGAVGMWQFMPSTGRGMGLRIDSLVDERMDPVRSTHAAARHLRDLHRRFRGDWPLAAAAYNAGEGRINRGLGRYGATDFWDLANRGDLAQETRRYVPRLFATTIIAKDPVRFGYPAPGLVRRFAYDSVRVDLATPLSVLAQVGSLSLAELTELNPHLFRQVAPRNYWVWVPFGRGRSLQQAFTASEFRQRGGYATYRVREGDSLARLAELSGLSTEQIRSMNLSAGTDALRPGTTLRLYADAARVLNARPEPRVARSEPSGDRPRVLGDTPANAASASQGAASTREPRGESSSPRAGTATSEPRGGSGTTARSGSAESPSRRPPPSAAGSGAARAGGERAPSSTASPERRTGSPTAERSSERRTEPGTAEPNAPSERRSGTAESPARRPPASGTGSGRASSERASSSSAPRRGTSSPSSPSARTHTVEDGETLWAIARRHEVTVEALREANGLEESEAIRPGQTLRIPRAASAAPGAASAPTEPASRSSTSTRPPAQRESSTARPSASPPSGSRSGAARPREHTVADGETLWAIARRYQTTVESLRRANDLAEDQQIRPGQKLTIPEN